MENEMIIVKTIDERKIMVYRDVDSWEVYYKKPGFPFEYAFGLTLDEELQTVFEIAEANIDDYDYLFEED